MTFGIKTGRARRSVRAASGPNADGAYGVTRPTIAKYMPVLIHDWYEFLRLQWRFSIWLALAFSCFLPANCQAQTTTLNVGDFGARGDAIQTFANTVRNSAPVTLAPGNSLSSADAGKIIELFGVGPQTTGANNQ